MVGVPVILPLVIGSADALTDSKSVTVPSKMPARYERYVVMIESPLMMAG